MSSSGDGDGRIAGGESPEERPVCQKCKKEQSAVTARKVNLCKNCFLPWMRHKFAGVFAPLKVYVPADGRVKFLCALSDGESSRAMLGLLADYVKRRREGDFGHLGFGVVYVDRGLVVGRRAEERTARVAAARHVAGEHGAAFFVTCALEEVFVPGVLRRNVERQLEEQGVARGAWEAGPLSDDRLGTAGRSSPAVPSAAAAAAAAGAGAASVHGRAPSTPVGGGSSGTDLQARSVVVSRGIAVESVDTGAQSLSELLAAARSATARADFVSIFTQKLLRQVAEISGSTKLILGSCSDSIAARVLGDIAKGRGACVVEGAASFDAHLDTGAGPERSASQLRASTCVHAMRPMHDLLRGEICVLNALYGFESVQARVGGAKEDEIASRSLDGHIRAFLENLTSQGFSATVSTVVRTSEKFRTHDGEVAVPRKETITQNGGGVGVAASAASTGRGGGDGGAVDGDAVLCPLCAGRRTAEEGESARNALREAIARTTAGAAAAACGGCSRGAGCACGAGGDHAHAAELCLEDVGDVLCYGCRVLVRDMPQEKLALPSFVGDRLLREANRERLRASVADFLLPEGND